MPSFDHGEALMIWRRNTARVLLVDPEGRGLLLRGWDPLRPRDRYWFTVGGATARGETLRAAAVRETREEVGIMVDEASLGSQIEASTIESTMLGIRVVQDLAYYAVAVRDVTINLGGMGWIERATVNRHAWLTPEELEADPVRSADPRLPDMLRLAVAAVRGR
jgi:8-oxo-dGTP pyrophosphatase MutT (NUDIX family)